LGEIRLGEMGLGEMGLGEMGQNRSKWGLTEITTDHSRPRTPTGTGGSLITSTATN